MNVLNWGEHNSVINFHNNFADVTFAGNFLFPIAVKYMVWDCCREDISRFMPRIGL
jgi:uncharacterized membrane protein